MEGSEKRTLKPRNCFPLCCVWGAHIGGTGGLGVDFFYSGKAETFQNRCHLQKSSQKAGKGASEIVVQNPPKKCDIEGQGRRVKWGDFVSGYCLLSEASGKESTEKNTPQTHIHDSIVLTRRAAYAARVERAEKLQ